MKLIKAHIINFGKFHDFDINFKDGLNSFVFENGWGKTTLSVFIKAMFYGMELTTKKSLEENERKKYSPWQGGIYGGSLTFSYKEKDYCVSRSFGQKKNEDSVEIRDLKTNKIIEDFSQDLGSFLFGVNRETFERSVHVTLEQAPIVSNDISARLNNLVEAADVANFDQAYSVLNEKASAIKAKKGKNDLISKIQEKIDEDREALINIDSRLSQNEEFEAKISGLEEKNMEQQKKLDSLTEQLSESARYESKLHYEELKKSLKEAESAKEALLDFFNGNVPEEKTLKTIDEISSHYTTLTTNIKNNSASQAEKDQYEALQNYFGGDIPSKEQIDSCIKTDQEYKAFILAESQKKLLPAEKEELTELKKKFNGKDISDTSISDCTAALSEIQNLERNIGEVSLRLQEKNNAVKNDKSAKSKLVLKILFIILSLLSAAAALVFFLLKLPYYTSIACGAGFVLFLLPGIFIKGKGGAASGLTAEIEKLNEELEEYKALHAKKDSACKSFLSQFIPGGSSDFAAISRLNVDYERYKVLNSKATEYEAWLTEQPKQTQDYENELMLFVKRFCKTDKLSSVSSEIQILNEKLNRLRELEKKIGDDSQNTKEQQEVKENLEKILAQYKSQKALTFAEQVQELHNKINDIKNADRLIEQSLLKQKEFEANPQNDIEAFKNLAKPEKSVAELQEEHESVSEQIRQNDSLIAGYKNNILTNLTYTDRKEDIETEIESLLGEKNDKNSEYHLLQKTMEFLSKAKEKLDANYSDPMKESFEKYLKLLGGKLKLVIDTDLKVSVDDEGRLHESDYLSAGYKDLVNFCSRMALIDALFGEEKPPVILDDPFVNLDDDKVPRALSLLQDMSQEKQLIYFACHKSRVSSS